MRSTDWRRSDCRRCTRPTAGRCGCAAARRTCAAFETCLCTASCCRRGRLMTSSLAYADCRPTDWTFLHTACEKWNVHPRWATPGKTALTADQSAASKSETTAWTARCCSSAPSSACRTCIRSRRVTEMSSVRTPAALVSADHRTWRTHVQRTVVETVRAPVWMCRPHTYIHNIISLCPVWRGVGLEIVARGRSLVAGMSHQIYWIVTDRRIRHHSSIIRLRPQ